jgi:hypothetical protein
MGRLVFVPATLALLLSAGCGDKDDSGSDGPGGTEVAYECDAMCTDEGFSGGAGAEYDHEVNCTCEGSGEVSDAACAAMCTEIGWASSQTYSTTGGAMDSCQCSG